MTNRVAKRSLGARQPAGHLRRRPEASQEPRSRSAGRGPATLDRAGLAVMQRQAGNTAVAGLVQRSPDFGLATRGSTSDFADTALRWQKRYPGTTVDSFAVIMLAETNERLGKLGVPDIDPGSDTSGSVGMFDSSTWTMSLDLEKETGHPRNTKVGELGAEDFAELVHTVYHEARHAEQKFILARYAAGQSKEKDKDKLAAAIAAEYAIKDTVAKAAVKTAGGLSGAQTATAEQLFAFHKKYLDYKVWNNRLMHSASGVVAAIPDPSPQGVDSIIRLWTAIEPKVTGWNGETGWADTQVESLSKLKRRDSVDEQVLRDLRATRKKMTEVFDAAKVLRNAVDAFSKLDRKTMTADEARRIQGIFARVWLDLEVPLRGLDLAASGAYERYPEEADTRPPADAVYQAVKKKASSGAKPAKAGVP